MTDYTEFRAIAKAATPGPYKSDLDRFDNEEWAEIEACVTDPTGNMLFRAGTNVLAEITGAWGLASESQARKDALFFATFSPEVVLGLLDKLEQYETHAKALDDLAKVQSQDGNWNYDAYLHGMANGLILAQNCIRSGGFEEPVFLDAPAVWLADIPAALNPTEAQG